MEVAALNPVLAATKVKFSVCKMMCGGMEVYLHSFLTSAPDGVSD